MDPVAGSTIVHLMFSAYVVSVDPLLSTMNIVVMTGLLGTGLNFTSAPTGLRIYNITAINS